MSTGQQNGLDGRKIADLIGLIDSPVDAEAAGAVHRIRVLKKKNGDVPFYELIERPDYKAAIWEKFGKPECLKGQMEAAALIETLRHDNAQLRNDNAHLEKDGAALALAVKQQESVINRQESVISELRQQVPRAGSPARPPRVSAPDIGLVNGGLVAVMVMIVAALLVLATLH